MSVKKMATHDRKVSSTSVPLTLIPVLVTGIQSTRVCAAKDSLQPKDLGWLDPCDILGLVPGNRDEG